MAGDRSRELRRLASECLTLGAADFGFGVRASLLEMAQKRIDLAELSEHDAWNEALRLRALQTAIARTFERNMNCHENYPTACSHS